MAALDCEQSRVMEEMSRAHELMSQLRAIVLPSAAALDGSGQLVRDLFEDISESFTIVLSKLQSCSQTQAAGDSEDCDRLGGHRSKRRKLDVWTILTSIPHNDGHQWRKYGQKKINSSKFPRSYYRCGLHKEQGCSATKTVQQKDENHDPPKYEVTYQFHHTCKAILGTTTTTTTSAPPPSSLSNKKCREQQPPFRLADNTANNDVICSIGSELELDELLVEPCEVEKSNGIMNILSPWEFSEDWSEIVDLLD